MIVICTKCQAKFRVPDDKIGPRGAKVRCSRCQTIFKVERGAAPAAPPSPVAPASIFAGGRDDRAATFEDGALRAPGPPLAPGQPHPAAPALAVELENPFVAKPVRGPPPPPFATRPPAADPFAAAGFGEQVAPDDPFAAAHPAAADPFASRTPASDPFAAPPPDPFEAPAPPLPPDPAAAVTDLSDLLGSATPVEVPRPPRPPPLPATAYQPPVDPPAPDYDGGLSLEDRVTPPPLHAGSHAHEAGAIGDLGVHAGPDGFGGGLDPRGFGAFDLDAAEGDHALATEPSPAARSDEPAGAALVAAAPGFSIPLAPAVPAPAARRPTPAPVAGPAREVERPPRPRGSRLRALVVNALALGTLLVVALALLVVWRSEGHLDAVSLRPSAVLAALRRGSAAGPFAAHDVRAGVYEREKGTPVLFVRGKVVSRAPAPVRGVKVSVEVVREGEVVARGEALAGAVPTPEELYRAADGAAIAALAHAAAKRAPAEVRPGDAVPFLVAIADHPADLDGASLRVALAVAGGAGGARP